MLLSKKKINHICMGLFLYSVLFYWSLCLLLGQEIYHHLRCFQESVFLTAASRICEFTVFIKLRSLLAIISSLVFLLPPLFWQVLWCAHWDPEVFSQFTVTVHFFVGVIFSPCVSFWIISISLSSHSLILPLAMSNLPIIPSRVHFIWEIIVLISLEIRVGSFWVLHISTWHVPSFFYL